MLTVQSGSTILQVSNRFGLLSSRHDRNKTIGGNYSRYDRIARSYINNGFKKSGVLSLHLKRVHAQFGHRLYMLLLS